MYYEEDKDTRYEKARLIGARALQIAMGAPVLVDRDEEYDPVNLAKREYDEDRIPMTVIRSSREVSRKSEIERPKESEGEEEESKEEESEESEEESE